MSLVMGSAILSGCGEQPVAKSNTQPTTAEQVTQSVSQVPMVSQFVEGKHYQVVDSGSVEKGVVREYMSYWCGHCLKFEGVAHKIKSSLPVSARFERNHVDFLGFTSQEDQAAVTNALAVARGLSKEVEVAFSKKLFQTIVAKKQAGAHQVTIGQGDLVAIFVDIGVEKSIFDKMSVEPAVIKDANEMRERQYKLSSAGALKGVPTVIVNGKYLINFAEINQARFVADFEELTHYLLAM